MLKQYIFFSFLFTKNFTFSENNNKSILHINLSSNHLQAEFNQLKSFYVKFLTEYYKSFKKPANNFIEKIHRTKFIKKFYDNNYKLLENSIFINMMFPYLVNENFNEINIVNKDWEKNLIKNIEFTDSSKLLKINIETMSAFFAINELLENKKISLEEANNLLELIREFTYEEEKKIVNIKKIIEFKDLNPENYSNEEKIIKLKNDEKTNNFIRNFLNSGKFSRQEKQYINDNIWIAIKFLDSMYEEYFHYFNNRESNFNKEIEIIKKIIYFKSQNDVFKNLSYLDVYILIKDMFPFKIERINDKHYIFKIDSIEKYSKWQILQLEDLQKLIIIFNSFYMLSLVLVKNNINNSKLEDYLKAICAIYNNFYQQINKIVETNNI